MKKEGKPLPAVNERGTEKKDVLNKTLREDRIYTMPPYVRVVGFTDPVRLI
ncbi:hypothetical protein [Clostridium sp. AM58-1XD]|uniref:hypothetical protein n=1 Tax=Clostridium sp. AM58-1XD TaxID=2292307 RepID=UPI0015F57ECD|nr:hypothetical protein [Clostridium sp. AM58-1XD]